MPSLNRDIANSIGVAVENDVITETGEISGGVSTYATTGDLPTIGNSEGDQAFVTGNDRLYLWTGAGWYNIALVNNAPTIDRVLDSDNDSDWTSFALNTDGSTSTITLVATDPEGFDITYTATTDSNFDALASISNDSSVFTITPKSSDSATQTSGSITFTASDGISIASAIRTFTLQFRTDWSSFTKELIDADDLSNFGQNGISDYLGSFVELGRTTGNIALVGEQGYDQGYTSYGTHYLLTYDGTDWSSQRIDHGLSNHEYYFGSLANGNFISKDEQHFWIFGRDNGSNPSSNCGNIQYWYLDNGTWTRSGTRFNGTANNFWLGGNLWLNDDGTYMVASEHGYNSFEGRVRHWTRSGTTWTEQTNIRVSGASTYAYFAYQLVVSPNFDYATVTYGGNSHSQRQFKNYSISGSTWTLDNTQTMTQAGVPTNRYIYTDIASTFRTDVNYTTLIVPIVETSSPYQRRIGVFHRDATNNTWEFATELTRQDTSQNYYRAVISPDGLEVLQMSNAGGHGTSGTVERYSRDSVTSTTWTYTGMTVDFIPSTITMTNDKILIGSPDYSKSNNSMSGSGGVQFLYP